MDHAAVFQKGHVRAEEVVRATLRTLAHHTGCVFGSQGGASSKVLRMVHTSPPLIIAEGTGVCRT